MYAGVRHAELTNSYYVKNTVFAIFSILITQYAYCENCSEQCITLHTYLCTYYSTNKIQRPQTNCDHKPCFVLLCNFLFLPSLHKNKPEGITITSQLTRMSDAEPI